YALTSLFDEHPDESTVHAFDVVRLDHRAGESGRWRIAVGQARVTSRITTESDEMNYGVLHFGDHNLTGAVRRRGDDGYREMVEAVFAAFERADLPGAL